MEVYDLTITTRLKQTGPGTEDDVVVINYKSDLLIIDSKKQSTASRINDWCVDRDIDAVLIDVWNGLSHSGRYSASQWRIKDENERLMFCLQWGCNEKPQALL
jgi:hypothetical protein